MDNFHTSSDTVKSILKILDELYPDAKCSLDFQNPLQLLVATVLSAQCTDERVNKVVPALFKKYESARDYAEAPLEELEQEIKSTGFYHNKALAIKESSKILSDRFDGQVPADMETLIKLPGIGRKTANVILGNAFGIAGIVVDTHVARVSARLGLTSQKEPPQNRTGADGHFTEGQMDKIFSPANPAWQKNLHCKKAEMFDLPFATTLRLWER